MSETSTKANWVGQWSAVRVPVSLKKDLEELLGEITDHYEATGNGLPEGANPDKIALWVAIRKSLDDYKAHKQRSRNRKKAK